MTYVVHREKMPPAKESYAGIKWALMPHIYEYKPQYEYKGEAEEVAHALTKRAQGVKFIVSEVVNE